MELLEALADLAAHRTSCLVLVVTLSLAVAGLVLGLGLALAGRSVMARLVSNGMLGATLLALVGSGAALVGASLECRVDALAAPHLPTPAEVDQQQRLHRMDEARILLVWLNPALMLVGGLATRSLAQAGHSRPQGAT